MKGHMHYRACTTQACAKSILETCRLGVKAEQMVVMLCFDTRAKEVQADSITLSSLIQWKFDQFVLHYRPVLPSCSIPQPLAGEQRKQHTSWAWAQKFGREDLWLIYYTGGLVRQHYPLGGK